MSLQFQPSSKVYSNVLQRRLVAAAITLFTFTGIVALSANSGIAQETASPTEVAAQSTFVILDPERLYAESAFGLRIQEELKVLAREIQSENGKLTRDLEVEELNLLEQREILSPEAFRDLADAFDRKVQSIRDAQERKGNELNARANEGRQEFNQASLPILQTVLKERNALGILDSRVILLPDPSIDITNEAILRVDQILKDGEP